MMEIEKLLLAEVMPTKIWIESGMFGERSVMMQIEKCDAFEYAIFGHDYRYTNNALTLAEAEALARQLGATEPIEHRTRKFELPTADDIPSKYELLTADDLREQIAELTEELTKLENKTLNA